MCGIAGVVAPQPLTVGELESRIKAMTDKLRHRGPDDAGLWTGEDGRIGLGHRRLSILDLSPRGHQPMLSSCGRFVLTFNGEIYNFSEIRKLLEEQRGTQFRGESDTEVLVEAISAWGITGALKASNGMFALGVWDRASRRLTLARDRLGEKPLLYGHVGDSFVFASELGAIKALPGFSSEINRTALASLLQYAYVPAPVTIYEGIHKLPPGTLMTVGLDTQAAGPTPYWSMEEVVDSCLSNQWPGSDQEAIDHLDLLLRDAVGMRMRADVPLGALLSGGIDSSVVIAQMQAQAASRVLTFTIGFDEPGYDETAHASRVANHLGTEHTEMYVSSADAAHVVERLPSMYGEPFADVSQIPTFLVSQLAKRDVTVALSGDGGDEVFGGYTRYSAFAALTRWLGKVPRGFRQAAGAVMGRVPSRQWAQLLAPISRFMPDARSQTDPAVRIEQLVSVLKSPHVGDWFSTMVSHWTDPSSVVQGGAAVKTVFEKGVPAGVGPFTSGMYLDLLSYLPDDVLTKLDRASMAVSLECRVPLLDHRIVEFAWSLPLSLKVREGEKKWALRQVLERYLPRSLYDRPKMGFGVPIGRWLRSSLRPWAEDLLDPVQLSRQGYLDAGVVRAAWDRHLAGTGTEQYRLWTILMFQAWLAEQ